MRTFGKVSGINKKLGLVFGYAAITKQAGEEYFDLAGESFTDDSIVEATVDFMLSKRVMGDMHEAPEGGSVVFAWPMTEEIAKAFDIDTKGTYGLMVAMKPANAETLAKFESGEYTGFSLGGQYVDVRETEEA